MADAFFTSAFGGIADMAGSAAGLVAVGNSPNRTSTCQLGGANEANQFYCESIHRSSWDQLGRLTLRLDFVCRVPDIKLSAATMTRNPLVLHADRGSVVAKKAALAFDPKVFLAVVGSGKTISHYRKGEAIFAQGDPGDAVFFIEKGRLFPSKARKRLLRSSDLGTSSARDAWAVGRVVSRRLRPRQNV
jgi:hypothetical protein